MVGWRVKSRKIISSWLAWRAPNGGETRRGRCWSEWRHRLGGARKFGKNIQKYLEAKRRHFVGSVFYSGGFRWELAFYHPKRIVVGRVWLEERGGKSYTTINRRMRIDLIIVLCYIASRSRMVTPTWEFRNGRGNVFGNSSQDAQRVKGNGQWDGICDRGGKYFHILSHFCFIIFILQLTWETMWF